MSKNMEIEWLEDSWDCDDCGISWASGAKVTFEDATLVDFQPVAHCYDSQSWDREEVYRAILEKLGYIVVDV